MLAYIYFSLADGKVKSTKHRLRLTTCPSQFCFVSPFFLVETNIISKMDIQHTNRNIHTIVKIILMLSSFTLVDAYVKFTPI